MHSARFCMHVVYCFVSFPFFLSPFLPFLHETKFFLSYILPSILYSFTFPFIPSFIIHRCIIVDVILLFVSPLFVSFSSFIPPFLYSKMCCCYCCCCCVCCCCCFCCCCCSSCCNHCHCYNCCCCCVVAIIAFVVDVVVVFLFSSLLLPLLSLLMLLCMW